MVKMYLEVFGWKILVFILFGKIESTYSAQMVGFQSRFKFSIRVGLQRRGR